MKAALVAVAVVVQVVALEFEHSWQLCRSDWI